MAELFCSMGKGLPWSVADKDTASGKTLSAIHRGRGWPYSSVKKMAARLKEGDLDANIKMHCGRKRKITKEDRKKIEQRIREVPETSIKQIQHWFVTETGKKVCRATMRTYVRMAAKPFKRTKAHFLSGAHKVRRLNWCLDMKRRIGAVPAAACSSGRCLMRKCSMKTTP